MSGFSENGYVEGNFTANDLLNVDKPKDSKNEFGIINNTPTNTFQTTRIDKFLKIKLFLCRGVQIDSNYENVPWFNSPLEQALFFLRQVTARPTGGVTPLGLFDAGNITNLTLKAYNCSMLDMNKGIIRIGISLYEGNTYPLINLAGINYLMFTYDNNIAISGSTTTPSYIDFNDTATIGTWVNCNWNYAFIDSINYINNNTIEIHFTLDVMQTYIVSRELSVRTSYVERCTPLTDNYFENIVEEGLDVGGYHKIQQTNMGASDLSVCMQATGKVLTRAGSDYVDLNSPDPVESNNIYSPLTVYTHTLNSDSDLNEIHEVINKYITNGYENAIVNFFMFPSWLTDKQGFWENGDNVKNTHAEFYGTTVLDGGYVPKNKKLYNYPYNFLYVINNNGQSATFHFEDFTRSVNEQRLIAPFELRGVLYPTASTILYPSGYKATSQECFDEGLVMSNFPTCAFSGDVYKAWLAQNKNTLSATMLSTTLSTVANYINSGISVGAGAISTAMGNPLGGVQIAHGVSSGISSTVNGFNSINMLNAKQKDLQNVPPQMHGQVQCEGLTAGLNNYKYSLFQMSAKKEYLKIIDDYFTMFGYAQHKLMNVNELLKKTNKYRYIKTQDCKIYFPSGYYGQYHLQVALNNTLIDLPYRHRMLRAICSQNIINKIESIFNKGFRAWYNPDFYNVYYEAKNDNNELPYPKYTGLTYKDGKYNYYSQQRIIQNYENYPITEKGV